MSAADTSAIGSGDQLAGLEGCDPTNTRQGVSAVSGLERLYREHSPRLLRFLAGKVGREDAGDLVQEAFAKLAGMMPGARAAIERPEAFVTTVAINALRDRARTAARQALHMHEAAGYVIVPAADPQQVAESREALRAIERALSLMNPRRRRIFLLHRHERLTYAEIGSAVGMSEKGVKKQMAKALLELRCAVERQP